MARRNVLIVEDNGDQREALAITIGQWGYDVETASDGQEAIQKLGTFPVHVVVTDLAMPRLDGIGLLRWMNERQDMPPAIVMTAYHDMNKAVTVVHELGAFWFLEKPFNPDALRVLVARAADFRSLRLEKECLERRLAYSGVLGEMVGYSPAMQRLFGLVQQVASTSVSVLITGESGTGKEIVAQTIHQLSARKDGPFMAVNCAALPESLMESELFGFEKGSFTGAAERRLGCFELSRGGTLLLDEIGEMHHSIQAKLLRVLEDHRVRRLGGKSEVPVDVRVIAATNKIPEVAVSKGELRQDLYYRLNVFHIGMPPLRERIEDLPMLVEALLPNLNRKHSCQVSGVDPAALEELQRHDWPGNVRELRNVLERAVILAGEGMITRQHLSVAPRIVPETGPQEDRNNLTIPLGITAAEAETRLVLKTLEYTNNNKPRAAQILGLSLKTLYNKLNQTRRAGDRDECPEDSV